MRVDRLNLMERYIIEHRTATLQELSDKFEISLNTVRRDLDALFKRGHIYKVYGGAAARGNLVLAPVHERILDNQQDKAVIGRLAATLVKDNDVIFLDAGSTVPFMIPHLAGLEGITIITHSLTVMVAAQKYPNLQVIGLGGYFNHTTSTFIGDQSILEDLKVDTAFLAGNGVSPTGIGCSCFNEYRIKKHMRTVSANAVFLGDHSKFDKPVAFNYAQLSDLSCIVTDRMPSSEYASTLKSLGVRLLCPENAPIQLPPPEELSNPFSLALTKTACTDRGRRFLFNSAAD